MAISWSYSMYSKAHECLACFQRKYLLGEVTKGPESADLAFGSAMHSALNACVCGDDGEAVFDTYWQSYKDKPVTYGRYDFDALDRLGQGFISKFMRRHAEKYVLERAEERLQGSYAGVALNGQFDFYGTLCGTASLLDWKTSYQNYSADKARVALQLYLYAYLAQQNGCKAPKQIGYVVFNKGTGSIQNPLVWDYDPRYGETLIQDMVDHCRAWEQRKTYPRNPNARNHDFPCYPRGAASAGGVVPEVPPGLR